MLDPSTGVIPQFSLGQDQVALRDMARAFAAEVFAPHAIEWDEAKHFPVAEMRKAAALGMGGCTLPRTWVARHFRAWTPP
jgi:alkylation response protein AidB-like acyl-CoA dehydrogenase